MDSDFNYSLGGRDDLAGTSQSQTFVEHDYLFDDDNSFITKLDSTEIVYCEKQKSPRFIGKYLKGDIIGEGSYSKVKECLDTQTLRKRAVKIMKRLKLKKITNGEENVKREIAIMQLLRHKNVVQLIEVLHNYEKQKIYIILEHCCCDMQDLLSRSSENKFPIWQAHCFFTQVIDGLEYLHGKGIIHKDIKPGNLLLLYDHSLKISDFGVAEQLSMFATDDCISCSQGSPAFQSPEVSNGEDVFPGFKLDVWSAGVTLYNMCSGTYPFEGDNIYQLFNAITAGGFTFPPELKNEHFSLCDLLSGMLAHRHSDRFGVINVKEHIWFRKRPPRIGGVVFNIGEADREPALLPYIAAWFPSSDPTSDTMVNNHSISEVGLPSETDRNITPVHKKSKKQGCSVM